MIGKHLFGIYEKALPPELSWQERLCVAKEFGFDFVEISIDESNERLARLDMGAEEKNALHRAINRTGIPLQTMCLSAHRRFPFGSANTAVREEAHRIMEKAIFFAAEFGIRVIQLAGYNVYYEESTAESVKRFEEGLAKACRLAEQNQVMLAVEIMDTDFINSISKYKYWKSKIPSPWFTVYPDLGNLSAWCENPVMELSLGMHEIVSVHLKDTLAVSAFSPGKFRDVTFGEGCVDFPACFSQLEEQGYCGPYTMEMWYDPKKDWRKELQCADRYLRQMFSIAMEKT